MTENRAAEFNRLQAGFLPALLGLEWDEVTHGLARARFTVQAHHMAPNGFLHAAAVIALVDSASGYGCMSSLPDGASGFTTIELKSNHLGTAKVGEAVTGEARLAHAGRMTQVWDAAARNETTDRTIALFRCTQMILYPR